MSEVVTLGETMAVLRQSGPPARPGIGGQFTLSVAGAEATVAIGLARLGHQVSWVGRVGRDRAGTLVVETLRSAGVGTGHVVTDPDAPTGMMLRWQRTGERAAVDYYRSASAGSRLTGQDVLAALSSQVRVLHTTGVTTALSDGAAAAVTESARRAHGSGAVVCFDVNYRERLTTVRAAGASLRALLPHIDVLMCGADELPVLQAAAGSADPVDAALAAGVREVVIKDGRNGATASTRDGQAHMPALPVRNVVDLIGAGDAFAAGYLSALLDQLPVRGRLARAATVAAFCVSTAGDWEGLPERAELDVMALPDGFTLR